MGKKVARGSISANKNRATENHPAYKGSLTTLEGIPAGTKVWIAGWDKENERGPWISLQFEIAEDRVRPESGPRPSVKDVLNDEIPF